MKGATLGLYDSMRGSAPPTDPTRRYGFTPNPQSDPTRFRVAPPQQPAVPPSPTFRVNPGVAPMQGQPQTTTNGLPRGVVPNARNQDGDRPYAYTPAVRANGQVEHWRPPTFGEILKELGWRLCEAGIQAVAYEVAYFFGARRLGVPTYVQKPGGA